MEGGGHAGVRERRGGGRWRGAARHQQPGCQSPGKQATHPAQPIPLLPAAWPAPPRRPPPSPWPAAASSAAAWPAAPYPRPSPTSVVGWAAGWAGGRMREWVRQSSLLLGGGFRARQARKRQWRRRASSRPLSLRQAGALTRLGSAARRLRSMSVCSLATQRSRNTAPSSQPVVDTCGSVGCSACSGSARGPGWGGPERAGTPARASPSHAPHAPSVPPWPALPRPCPHLLPVLFEELPGQARDDLLSLIILCARAQRRVLAVRQAPQHNGGLRARGRAAGRWAREPGRGAAAGSAALQSCEMQQRAAQAGRQAGRAGCCTACDHWPSTHLLIDLLARPVSTLQQLHADLLLQRE